MRELKQYRRTIKGCCEVTLMVLRESESEKPFGETPQACADYYRRSIEPEMVSRDVEVLHVLYLNTRRKITSHAMLSTGTGDTLLVSPTIVFRGAILAGAAGIVLIHNHPSGDPSPSEADIRVTKDLMKGGAILKCELLDHLVMGDASAHGGKGYTSLKEQGYFYA